MSHNIVETANSLADLMEKGLNTEGVRETHEWFLVGGDDDCTNSACALGFATVGKEGAKKAYDNLINSDILHFTEYIADSLGISQTVAIRMSNDHAHNLIPTKQIIERLRKNPEVYFY